MKKILTLILVFIGTSTFAQKVVEVKVNNVTSIIFPENIDYFKGGFFPDDFLIEKIKNVLYITPVYEGVSSTNMNIVTIGGMYFSIQIKYNKDLEQFNYILSGKDAFYKDSSRNDSITKRVEIKDSLTNMADIIFKEPGFITTNNTKRYKNFFFYLKGVYVKDNVIFIRLDTRNNSNIKFDYDYIAFYVNIRKERKRSASEQLQLFPIRSFNFKNSLESGKNQEILFAFDKFTIGEGKILNIDLIEKNGERNLSLKIDDRILLDAKKIEL